jgi:hypothetical protein
MVTVEALFGRAPRSTKAFLADVEDHQSAVIDVLVASGDIDLAIRLARCQYERQNRHAGWPWRCLMPGCWACRRVVVRRWWRGFRLWLGDPATSLALVPLDGDRITANRKLRKGLRDVRDRAARHRRHWRSVAMAGLVSEDCVMLLVQHAGITRAATRSMLERRWPGIMLSDVGNAEPSAWMTVEHAVALARRRRAIEPIRVAVPPQMVTTNLREQWDEPMPMVF